MLLKKFGVPFINRGIAAYVQIIHTDTLFSGTSFQCGHVDIYVRDLPVGIDGWHGFATYLNMATAMKKLLLIAEKSGKYGKTSAGQLIELDKHPDQKDRPLKENEVFIGVYGEFEESKNGQKFYFSLKDRLSILHDSISPVVKIGKKN